MLNCCYCCLPILDFKEGFTDGKQYFCKPCAGQYAEALEPLKEEYFCTECKEHLPPSRMAGQRSAWDGLTTPATHICDECVIQFNTVFAETSIEELKGIINDNHGRTVG